MRSAHLHDVAVAEDERDAVWAVGLVEAHERRQHAEVALRQQEKKFRRESGEESSVILHLTKSRKPTGPCGSKDDGTVLAWV